MNLAALDPAPFEHEQVRVSVLVCEHLTQYQRGLDLHTLLLWLEKRDPALRTHVLPRLCTGSRQLGEIVSADGASRVVMALCGEQFDGGTTHAHLRQAGLDPLGIEIVNLAALLAPPTPTDLAADKAKLLLAAAVARARAFRGSSVANVKPSLPTKLSRRGLLRLPVFTYQAVPSVVRERCVADRGCTLCAGVCPYRALAIVDGKVELDKARCAACGLCVTACPRGAVYFPGYSPDQIEAEVRVLLDPSIGALQPRGILFSCARHSVPVRPLHPSWLIVRLPCLAMAPPTWFLAPFLLGAVAVGVLPCAGECRAGRLDVVQERVAFCHHLLTTVGARPEALAYCPPLDQFPDDGLSDVRTPHPGHDFSTSAFGVEPTTVAAVLRELVTRSLASSNADLAEALVIDHPGSPLGLVEINEQVCTGCGTCGGVCPSEALVYGQEGSQVTLRFHAASCLGCGQCLAACPERARGAINVRRATVWKALREGEREVYRDRIARCIACGAPIAPDRMLDRVMTLLGNESHPLRQILTGYCSSCRILAGHRDGGNT